MSFVDEAKVLRGRDIQINDFITIHQPSIDEIIEFGEQHFYSTFYSLCSIPSDMKSILWDMGQDWNKISDWELFINLSHGFTKEDTCLILGDIDFSLAQPMTLTKEETSELVLVLGSFNEEQEFIPDTNKIITEEIYNTFIPYIREMIGYTVKREKAANKITKLALVDEDRRNRATNSKKEWTSTLVSLIVSLVNTEEFSYKYEETFDMKLYQLMKSFIQIQKKKSACALYQGSMSGFVDTSKINAKNFQWIYTNDN